MASECCCNHAHGHHHEGQAAPAVDPASIPKGLRVSASEAGAVVRVRAGGLGLGVLAALAIAGVWTFFWGAEWIKAMHSFRAGTLSNPGAELTVRTIASLIGLYCVCLALYTMLGHERLVIRGNRLRLSSPWLFGVLTRTFDVTRMKLFACDHKDCHGGHDSCCSGHQFVDYPFTFGYGGHRVSVFPYLNREAKDWLCHRLNAILNERTSGT